MNTPSSEPGSACAGSGSSLHSRVPLPSVGDHSGWLQKAGHIRKDFKRRFFILRGARLAYYEDRAAANRERSKGVVTVRKVRHLNDGEGGLSLEQRPFAFHFDTMERKPFIVYADSMQEKLGWVRALLAASNGGTAPRTVPVSAVEDLYRDQVCAAEMRGTGDEASLTSIEGQSSWPSIANGAQLTRAQMYNEAIAAFKEALRHAGCEAQAGGEDTARLAALYELGKLLCETGDYAGALAQFEAAMLTAPPYVHVQIKLQCAWCSWRIGRLSHAGALYQQVLEDDPLCWQASLDRARMHLGCGEWEQAVPDLELVIGMEQSSAEVLNDRGVCFYELRQYERAILSFNGAVELNPHYPQAYTNRGNCYRKLGQSQEALADYSKAVDLDDTNPKSFNNRGALYLRMEKFSDAVEDFERALTLDPAYEVARKNRELARAACKRIDQRNRPLR